MFKKYRIKEVNEKFIPQQRTWFLFIYDWQGIDRKTDYLWTIYQYEQCALDTLEEAKERIKKCKPKYHNI